MILNTKLASSGGIYFDRTPTVTLYYNDVIKCDVLDKDEEYRLFKIYQDPNSSEYEKNAAKDKIVKSQLKFVIAAAKQYANNVNYLDMIQQGNLGVLEAIENFDLSKGVRFNTHAVQYIRRSISQYARDIEPTIHQTNTSKTQHIISKARELFIQEHEREPSSQELMDLIENEFKIKLGDKTDVLQVVVTSINDHAVSEGDNTSPQVADTIAFNAATATMSEAETNTNDEYNKMLLKSLLCKLSEREQKIVKMYYGIGCEQGGLDPKEISAIVGLTTERVRQIVRRAVERMRTELTHRIDYINERF